MTNAPAVDCLADARLAAPGVVSSALAARQQEVDAW